VKPEIDEISGHHIPARIARRIGDAESRVVPTEERVGLFRKPGFMAKFEYETYGMRLGSGSLRVSEKGRELWPVASKGRRKLEQDWSEVGPQRQRVLHERRPGLLDINEAFDVRDEAAGFQGKDELIGNLRCPFLVVLGLGRW
jgi:hypothetical protein